ncbi:MAG: radical SAM protein, partial [Promethearchaeota archaeon]
MNFIYFKQKIQSILIKYEKLNFINYIFYNLFKYHNLKYSNLILSNYEFNKQRLKLKSYPSEIYLNTTNLCNYRCSFCEIHYFYEYAKMLSGRVFSNNLTTVFINKFSDLFNRTFFLELSGATGEPFLNPNFNKLIKLLKRRKIELMVTTNGSLIKNNIAETLVDIQFDEILVSLHSGDPNCYTELQGGNYDEVVNNLKYLIKYRNIKGVPKPRVSINCLIFKSNQHTIKDLLKHMKSIDVDRVNLNHYYASRNKIQGDESFYFHPKEGNKFLHELYSYAKLLDLKLTP